MSETLISPGILTRENDLSFVQPAPVEVGAAFIGPTVKGPVVEPTTVTSYNEYVRKFGDIVEHSGSMVEFFTSMAVRSYFSQGGNTALISRVVSGSFTSAVSENKGQPFELSTVGKGSIYNSSSSLASDGSLASGSVDNFRWEIVSGSNAANNFTILIRRGDDTAKNKIILESFTVSLDPTSDNFIEKVIGNQYKVVSTDGSDTFIRVEGEYPNISNFVYVSSATANAAVPASMSGSFTGAVGSINTNAKFFTESSGSLPQGASSASYLEAFAVLESKDEYQFNIISAPGITVQDNSSLVDGLISLAESRQDCIAVVDTVKYGQAVTLAASNANAKDSSYAATYWPWVQVRSAANKNVFVPASTIIPSIFALTDRIAAPWFAPAGLLRGGLPGVIQTERKLTAANRDTLYSSNINPIATLPGQGIVVLGQKTLQSRASALDRVNVRRLLIELKKFVKDVTNGLLFEQNTVATRNRFLAVVNPYLESLIQRQGLYAYRVVMDDTNNTADIIDRNQLVGQIYIQPTKTAEFIILDFTVEPTGATFGA
jgi:hypothetical protein